MEKGAASYHFIKEIMEVNKGVSIDSKCEVKQYKS